MNRLLILSILATFALALPRKKPGGRIYNGDDAKEGEFPFMAALNSINGFEWCNGVILDTKWILTSAHCTTILYSDDVVKTGSYINLAGMGTDFNISKQITHEEFNQFNSLNDIALIQIDGELIFDNNTQPIEIEEAADGTFCQLLGWGATEVDEFPSVLQYANMTVMDLETCKTAIENNAYIAEVKVCASGGNNVGGWLGDFGASLVCDGKLIGLESTYFKGELGLPDVFTRIASYKDWIDATIAANG